MGRNLLAMNVMWKYMEQVIKIALQHISADVDEHRFIKILQWVMVRYQILFRMNGFAVLTQCGYFRSWRLHSQSTLGFSTLSSWRKKL